MTGAGTNAFQFAVYQPSGAEEGMASPTPQCQRSRFLRGATNRPSGCIFEEKGGDAGFLEDALLNSGRHRLIRFPRRMEGPPVKHVLGHAPAEGQMRAVSVVPDGEVAAEPFEMIESPDKRDPLQPFVFECFDGALGDGDGTVFAHGPEALLDDESFEKFFESSAGELNALVGDDVLGSAALAEGILHGLNDPRGIGPFQGLCGDDSAGEVVDGE